MFVDLLTSASGCCKKWWRVDLVVESVLIRYITGLWSDCLIFFKVTCPVGFDVLWFACYTSLIFVLFVLFGYCTFLLCGTAFLIGEIFVVFMCCVHVCWIFFSLFLWPNSWLWSDLVSRIFILCYCYNIFTEGLCYI